MVIGNGFFSDTEREAREEMGKLAGCRVIPCVFPTVGNLEYFISERGDIFSMQIVQGHYLTRGPKRAASSAPHGKRKDGGVSHRLVYAPKREMNVPCEVLVYCSFVLGRWDPEIKVEFVNGRADDIRLHNIRPCKKVVPPEWVEHMEEFQDIYKKEFNNIVRYVKWNSFLDIEDSKDVVQSTFVWLTTSGFKGNFNVALWSYFSLRRAIDFQKHFISKFDRNEFTEDKYIGMSELPYEVDLIAKVNGEKSKRYLKLWAQGHTPTEIAEMCNSTIGNVGSSVTRSIQFLQKYLKNEIKFL